MQWISTPSVFCVPVEVPAIEDFGWEADLSQSCRMVSVPQVNAESKSKIVDSGINIYQPSALQCPLEHSYYCVSEGCSPSSSRQGARLELGEQGDLGNTRWQPLHSMHAI